MPNPGQPTIAPGATGDAVRRLQRALRRTPDLGLSVDGVFGPKTETAVKGFQQGAGLVVDGIVGPLTWGALPDGGPMPTLQEGSTGEVVRNPHQWRTGPVEHHARCNRRQLWAEHQSISQSISGLGRSDFGRRGRRSDLGGVAACRKCHP